MKQTATLSLLLLLFVTSHISAQNTPWTFETSSGYDLGIGQAISWTKYGSSDPSYTYFSKTRDAVGNSGFHAEIRAGYDFFSNIGLTLATSILVGLPTLKSGYYYDTTGKVTENWSESFNYATIRITPAMRFWILDSSSFRLYSSFGPMIVVASPVNEESTNSVNSKSYTTRYFYGVGYGGQGELGTEFSLGKDWGIVVACSLEKISLPRTSIEDKDISGDKTTTTYTDQPSTNSDGQTASDIANSSSTHSYYSYPTVWDDFSDLSIKFGLVWHF